MSTNDSSETEELSVFELGSQDSRIGGLIVSAADISSGHVELVVGRVGYPNVEKTLRTGGAVLFETPDAGLLEVRVLKISQAPDTVRIRVSRVSPRRGITAGFVEHEPDNEPFSKEELDRVRSSLQTVANAATERADLTKEQVDLINRKLDEMATAATRMGRKDWVNLAVGQLTNLIVTAALGSGVGKFLFSSMGRALAWLIGEAVRFLP
jgi:hypothetical protein